LIDLFGQNRNHGRARSFRRLRPGSKTEQMSTMWSSDLCIRTGTNEDCHRVIELVSSVLAEFRLPLQLDSKDADLLGIEGNCLQAGGVFEVIEDKGGRLLGTYGLFPLNDNQCELRKMYFLAEIRGIGLGKAMLERAVAHARQLGFKSIVLETI